MTRNLIWIQLIYLVSTALFILSLKWMSHPSTARRGIVSGVVAMVAAIGGTLLVPGLESYHWIIGAIVVGFVLGVPLAMVPLTAVPQRTALSHAFGGLAAGLVGAAEYYLRLTNFTSRDELTGFHHRRPDRRSDPRLPDLHRQPHGGRQTAGNGSPPGPSPTRARTRSTSRSWASPLLAGVLLVLHPDVVAPVSRHRPALAGLRRAADHPHRRGRHAHGDRPAELLRRPVGRGHGLRA